jgi:hypothetical protein
MTEFQSETITKLRKFAALPENYKAGWDIIVEATTDDELLEYINGDTDESYASMLEIFDDYCRLEPATTYKEAKRRVQCIVKIHEEQKRAVENEIF